MRSPAGDYAVRISWRGLRREVHREKFLWRVEQRSLVVMNLVRGLRQEGIDSSWRVQEDSQSAKFTQLCPLKSSLKSWPALGGLRSFSFFFTDKPRTRLDISIDIYEFVIWQNFLSPAEIKVSSYPSRPHSDQKRHERDEKAKEQKLFVLYALAQLKPPCRDGRGGERGIYKIQYGISI